MSSYGEFDITGAEYAVLDMKLDSTSGKAGISDVMLRFTADTENGGEVVYEGIAAVTLGQYYRLYFDVSEYLSAANKIKRVSVWVKPHRDAENGDYKLLINGVSFTGMKGGSSSAGSVAKTVVIVIIIVVVLAAAAYGIMYLRAYINYKNKKKKIEEKRKKHKVK